jgi:hypothetical protein
MWPPTAIGASPAAIGRRGWPGGEPGGVCTYLGVAGGGGVVSFGRDDTGGGRRRRKGGAPAAACCPAATTTMRDIGQRRKVREGSGEEEWLGGCGLGREVGTAAAEAMAAGGRKRNSLRARLHVFAARVSDRHGRGRGPTLRHSATSWLHARMRLMAQHAAAYGRLGPLPGHGVAPGRDAWCGG